MTPIFSIDHTEARNERFTMSYGGTVYRGTIEWDGDCVDGEMVDASYFTLTDQDGNDAPDHVVEDDYVRDSFSEIKDALGWCDYTGRRFAPLDPIVPKQYRAEAA